MDWVLFKPWYNSSSWTGSKHHLPNQRSFLWLVCWQRIHLSIIPENWLFSLILCIALPINGSLSNFLVTAMCVWLKKKKRYWYFMLVPFGLQLICVHFWSWYSTGQQHQTNLVAGRLWCGSWNRVQILISATRSKYDTLCVCVCVCVCGLFSAFLSKHISIRSSGSREIGVQCLEFWKTVKFCV